MCLCKHFQCKWMIREFFLNLRFSVIAVLTSELEALFFKF